MKKFIYIVDCLIVLLIPLCIITGVKEDVQVVKTTLDIKKVNSLKLITNIDLKNTDFVSEEEKDETSEVKEENLEEVEEKTVSIEEKEEVIDNNTTSVEVVEEVPEQNVSNDILDTLVGSMSGYGPDCNGCRGYTSSGYSIKNNIYYQDSTYGSVRILAGDRSLKFGSIVRVKNSKLGEFIGIVLDRGGSVGIGRAHLFDLLFSSEKEAQLYEVSYNVSFEVLRYGY